MKFKDFFQLVMPNMGVIQSVNTVIQLMLMLLYMQKTGLEIKTTLDVKSLVTWLMEPPGILKR